MNRIVRYDFAFEDETSWSYELTFDESNKLVPLPSKGIKSWTRLDFQRCPHCPLSVAQHPQCPVAANVDTIVEDSRTTASIKLARVTVTTPERRFEKDCTTQEGLFSLFGLIMASSGCPHLDWLRPLARFHLPFATSEETLFRALSLQLLTELFERERVAAPRSAQLLLEKYAAVEKVNHTFIKRIREYCSGDADKNALAGLDVFVQLFQFHKENNFSALRPLFD